MRIILFILLLLSTFSTQGWGVTYDCSTANNAKVRINQIYNPQTGNEIGYLEIYVDNGPVNLEGWQVCYGDGSHNKCVDIGTGNGDVYLDGVLLGNDSDASDIPDNAFVVFSESLFATSGNPENTFAQAKGEAVLLDSNGDAAHYLRYHNSTFNQADWSAGSECTTDFVQPTANNNGICATPDFSQPDSQWSYNCDNTMGTYNADPASPLAEWRMDECFWNGTTGEVKDSQSTNNGTAKGLNNDSRVATTIENGILNRAGEFKGEGYNADPYNTWYTARYYLEVPDADSLSPLSITQGAQMSITGWFKLDSISGTHTILHKGGNHQEYRVYVENRKLYFTVWDVWGSPKTIEIGTLLSANQYYFFAVTAQGSVWEASPMELTARIKDGMSTYFQSDIFHLFSYNLHKDGELYFGATRWGGGITNFLNGYLDEIKLYNKALSSSEIDRLYTYESTGRNFDGTPRASDTCYTPPPPECTDFRYDLYHTADPYRLQTRIASRPFDVNVTVACTGTGAIPSRKIAKVYAFPGSCPANAAGLPLLWSGAADINESVRTITLGGLNSPVAYSIIGLMLETDAGEFYCSSDRFAIRPPSFVVSSPLSPIRAGEITLQVSASDSGGGYNGTATATTALRTADPDCPISSGFLSAGAVSEPLSLPFSGDLHTSEVNATDIGEITLSVRDTSWTAVDQSGDCIPASNSTVADALGRFGCNIDSNLSLKIVPHHFDVNATLSDFAGGSYTYLSRDLAMSADLDIKVTAKTSGGSTTRNYTQGCHAKNATLTLSHTTIPAPLTQILYDFNGAEENITKNSDIVLDLAESVFAEGVAPLQLRLNFDRDPARLTAPFDFSLETAEVADADAITNTDGITELSGNATYVYGRVRVYDIATDAPSAPNPVEFEVYSPSPGGFVSGMPQNTLGWYRNLSHDTAAEGNVIRGGFSAGADEIDVSASPANGVQVVTVTSSADQTVHLDIAPWLWYSLTHAYDYGADCASHPCFRYDYTGTAPGVTGVSSGTFQGSDFEMKPAKNITNKGVKVFR